LDGLSHRNVLCVFQDREDVTWFGTQNGLNRFDGYHFKHWLGKNQGVDLKYIYSITQDDKGWLWIKTGSENTGEDVIFFNPKTEIFQTITERFGEDCVLLDIIYVRKNGQQSFLTDKNGTVFFYKRKENTTILELSHDK
jgi:hypothetical protein